MLSFVKGVIDGLATVGLAMKYNPSVKAIIYMPEAEPKYVGERRKSASLSQLHAANL